MADICDPSPIFNCTREAGLSARNSEAAHQLINKQAAAGNVGLEPFAIDHQLRDGALADAAQDLGGGGGVGVDIDLSIDNAMLIEKLLGCAAVAAP
jgi:hypothetical protein